MPPTNLQSNPQRSSSNSIASLIPPSLLQAPPPTPLSHKNKYLSYIMMFISCLAWVTGYLYSNDHNLHPVHTSMLRGFMMMLVSFGICVYQKVDLDLRVSVKVVMERNGIFLMQGFIMAAIQFYLPLGIIHTLGNTGSIFVTIIQYIYERKKPHFKQILGMALTFLGIILIANGRLFSKWLNPQYQFQSDFQNYHSNDPKTIAICSLLFTLFMVLWAYGVYSTNTMKASPYIVNCLLGAKLYLVSSLLYPSISHSHPISPEIFYNGLIWTGILFAIAETCFVLSLVMAQNISMTIMLTSFTIVIAYAVSIFKYHEQVNGFCLLGSGFIIVGLARIILHHL